MCTDIFHQDHFVVRFVVVQAHEMIINAALEEDISNVENRYTY